MASESSCIESQRDGLLDQSEELRGQGVSEEELFTIDFSAQQE